MSYGFRVWDAAGNLEVDTSTRMGIVLGSVDVNTRTGSITDNRLLGGSPWSCITTGYLSTEFSFQNAVTGYPIITFSGNMMFWDYTDATYVATVAITYGIH